MSGTSTSFRIADATRRRLAERAARDGVSATALLERLVVEGIDAIDHPGVVHRGPVHDRRAALAAGPDVWEVVARLRELAGPVEERIRSLAAESDLHPRLIRIALDYAAAHPEQVDERIRRNEVAIPASRQRVKRRESLLA